MRAGVVKLLGRLPDAATVRISTIALLVIASSWLVYPRAMAPEIVQEMSRSDLSLAAVPTVAPASARISTKQFEVGTGSDRGPLASTSASESFVAQIAPTPTSVPDDGSLLPKHRVLLIYGLPGDSTYGMLADYDNLRLIELLQDKAQEYQEFDPDRPIMLGLEIVATAGQKSPGRDASYLRDTNVSTIYSYIEFTRANNMLLFLDVQVGRRTVPDEITRLQRYLLQPHVHVAIDPQFDVASTEIPTIDMGSTSAAGIRWAQEYLVELANDADLPPKILIVHQFMEEAIVNKPLLRQISGVQLVINVGLWGSPEEKMRAYNAFVIDDPCEFGGIMINGVWDDPAMTTLDVINLPQAPDIVIYQ